MGNSLREEIKNLLQKKPEGIALSFYLPTYRTNPEYQQNPIRLKNLLRQAEEKLKSYGLRQQETKNLLEPAYNLLNNPLFWRRLADGLTLFLSPGDFHHLLSPLPFDELVYVGNRYYLKPLLPLLEEEKEFYLLSLSQKGVKLWQGTKFSIKEREVEGLPTKMSEALALEEPQKQVRFHPSPGGTGERGALFSGHGADFEDNKENIFRYFRLVDRVIHKYLKEKRTPLLLAGVEYLFPIYREANTYPHLIDEGIPGNPDGLSEESLHRAAWERVKPYFLKTQKEALELFFQSSGTGLASTDLEEIIRFSFQRRVGVLFVAADTHRWGTISADGQTIIQEEDAKPGSCDLLEIAAIETYLNGGKVFVLPREHMPEKNIIAAVLRY